MSKPKMTEEELEAYIESENDRLYEPQWREGRFLLKKQPTLKDVTCPECGVKGHWTQVTSTGRRCDASISMLEMCEYTTKFRKALEEIGLDPAIWYHPSAVKARAALEIEDN